jgi:hypothetical protein
MPVSYICNYYKSFASYLVFDYFNNNYAVLPLIGNKCSSLSQFEFFRNDTFFILYYLNI